MTVENILQFLVSVCLKSVQLGVGKAECVRGIGCADLSHQEFIQGANVQILHGSFVGQVCNHLSCLGGFYRSFIHIDALSAGTDTERRDCLCYGELLFAKGKE